MRKVNIVTMGPAKERSRGYIVKLVTILWFLVQCKKDFAEGQHDLSQESRGVHSAESLQVALTVIVP
jgi:hypothetical protein